MMNRLWLLLFVVVCHISCHNVVAQVPDAFQGVLPVTDPTMKMSLNGEWQLKVVDGIDEQQTTIPAIDNTWRSIPVPERAATVAAGLVLIALGTKILLQHLLVLS